MATVRTIPSPPELAQAPTKVLSADARTVACRLEGEKSGLWAFDVGGAGGRPLRLDQLGKRYHSPVWTAWGDLLFQVDGAQPMVGVVPAFGRGSATEYPGSRPARCGRSDRPP